MATEFLAEQRTNGITLPDKVTIKLRSPERDVLADPTTRTILDLLYDGKIDVRESQGEIEVHSLVFLFQKFGIIDSRFNFAPVEGFKPQPYSDELSRILNTPDLVERVESRRGIAYLLSHKYSELIQVVGGPQTIKNKEKLSVLRTIFLNSWDIHDRVVKLANFLFLKESLDFSIEQKYTSKKQAERVIEAWFPPDVQVNLSDLQSSIGFYFSED